ncbi:MAG TPA: hypothetical protein VJ576_21335 [Rhodocyclaceae bacterium]|nr:hypothetical protein [Rhodocyclaceae bacterium]
MAVTEAAAPIMVYDLMAAPPSAVAAPAKIKPAARLKVAKKKKLNKSMLSRSARTQLQLAQKPRTSSPSLRDFSDGDDADTGADDLDFHRSFSRPRVAKVADQDDEDDQEISDHVRLRLFLARMKAVEAHKAAKAANQADDEAVSEAVKLRLFLARMKAVEAHQSKFS